MHWTPLRLCSLITAATCAVIIGAMYLSAVAYTGDFDGNEEFWLLALIGVASTVAYVAAHVRDQIIEAVHENRQALEDLPLHIADYGDRREIAGHRLVQRVAEQQTGRRLNSID